MGSLFSSPANNSTKRQLTPEQQDIKFLGDRFAFSDAELYQVYRAYHGLKNPIESFITDIGLLSDPSSNGRSQTGANGDGVNNADAQSVEDGRRLLLQVVEQRILSSNFGNTWYKNCFLRPQDASKDPITIESSTEDNTRLARLEAFFQGLCNASRRGSNASVKCLMECCTERKETDNGTVVRPLELVTIGYRLALASAFLSATQDYDNMERFLPSDDKDEGLVALAQSLIDVATRRKQQLVRSSTPNSEENVEMVSYQDILEWVEQVAPLFGGTLATFSHQLFFPNRPYPPTRTTFDFPFLPMESSFFRKPNSPLLFSFGCMSPSLNGEVRESYVRVKWKGVTIAVYLVFTSPPCVAPFF